MKELFQGIKDTGMRGVYGFELSNRLGFGKTKWNVVIGPGLKVGTRPGLGLYEIKEVAVYYQFDRNISSGQRVHKALKMALQLRIAIVKWTRCDMQVTNHYHGMHGLAWYHLNKGIIEI